MLKSISLSLIALLLLQTCVVYQKTPVAISEAHDRGKVMVITNADEKLMFKKIIQKDSIYYGLTTKRGGDITQQLNVDEVMAIYLKDQNRSNRATIIVTVLITMSLTTLGLLLLAYALAG